MSDESNPNIPNNSEKEEIEKNKYVVNNKIDLSFVLKHYGESASFLNEILQTEGITPDDHFTLREISMRKTKWETRGGHWMGLLYGFYHLRLFFKTQSNFWKVLIALSYPVFFFDISYNLGRVVGNSLIMPASVNKLLKMNNGESIHAIQTRLFVKRCVYEDILIKNKKSPEKTWSQSFILNKVLGKSVHKVVYVKNYFVNLYEEKKQILFKK